MSVMSSCRPRNWNLPIAQPAATPNTTLAGTAIAAARSVSRKRRQRVWFVMMAAV